MTAPSYTTDLTDINLCTSATGWAEPTATGWTQLFGTITGGDGDDYIVSTSALSSQASKTGVGGLLYNVSGTIPTDGAFLIWAKWGTGGGLYSETNGGIRTVVGDALNSFYGYKQRGNDTYQYDSWINLATNPAATPDYTEGSYAGSATITYWGWCFGATSVPSKGAPYWVDVPRYGRCELRVQYGETADYCTFAGMAGQNDATANKWGLVQEMPYGFLWKGLITIGYNSVAADFRDSNVFVLLDNTKHVTSAFNKISLETSGSNCEWTNVRIKSLSTVSRGNYVSASGTTTVWNKCNFEDMGTFTFGGGTGDDITNTTFTRCNLITTGGGDFGSCIFDETNDSAKAVIVSSPAQAALITGSTFISSGTKHGLEIGGTAADFTLTDCIFSGYDTADPGTAANKAIYVNIATGTVNITISGGSGVTLDQHVRSAGATVNVIAGAVTVKTTVSTSAGVLVENALVFIKEAVTSEGTATTDTTNKLVNSGATFQTDGVAIGDVVINKTDGVLVAVTAVDSETSLSFASDAFPDGNEDYVIEGESVSIVNSGTTATVTHTSHGFLSNDYVQIVGGDIAANEGVFQITVTGASAYTYTMGSTPGASPTGVIASIFVPLYGLTNSSGVKSTARVYSANLPVQGWARKSSSSPYYKEGPISGTINTSDGLTASAVLVLDE